MPAESARLPSAVNRPGHAAVIDMTKRVGTRSTGMDNRGGRWHQVTEPVPHRTLGPVEEAAQQLLAEHFEETFNTAGLSLTDDKVAKTFGITLTIVIGMLEGATVQGIVDEAQRSELATMVEGMMAAPRHL